MTETNRIEYKQILTVDLEKEVVAFLNYRYGGFIYIGIDKTGKTIGVAIREAIINAMLHNDYTREIPPKFEIFPDRLEITSYGGLFEGMSKDDFFSGLSLPKNKELMRIFKDLDMVEQLGSGVPRILRAYSKDCFVFGDSFTRMIFPFKSSVKSSVKILNLISDNKNITIPEIAKELDLSSRAIEKQISKLKEQNKLKRIGPDKGGHWEVMV